MRITHENKKERELLGNQLAGLPPPSARPIDDMAGPVRHPIDVASLERYLTEHVPEIEVPLDVKQVSQSMSFLIVKLLRRIYPTLSTLPACLSIHLRTKFFFFFIFSFSHFLQLTTD